MKKRLLSAKIDRKSQAIEDKILSSSVSLASQVKLNEKEQETTESSNLNLQMNPNAFIKPPKMRNLVRDRSE